MLNPFSAKAERQRHPSTCANDHPTAAELGEEGDTCGEEVVGQLLLRLAELGSTFPGPRGVLSGARCHRATRRVGQIHPLRAVLVTSVSGLVSCPSYPPRRLRQALTLLPVTGLFPVTGSALPREETRTDSPRPRWLRAPKPIAARAKGGVPRGGARPRTSPKGSPAPHAQDGGTGDVSVPPVPSESDWQGARLGSTAPCPAVPLGTCYRSQKLLSQEQGPAGKGPEPGTR